MFLSLNLYFPLVPLSAIYATKEGYITLHCACAYTDTHWCTFTLQSVTDSKEKSSSWEAHKRLADKKHSHIYRAEISLSSQGLTNGSNWYEIHNIVTVQCRYVDIQYL
jgi:hypothetical protein